MLPRPLALLAVAVLLAACGQGGREFPRTHPAAEDTATVTPAAMPTGAEGATAGTVPGAEQLPRVRDLAEARARFDPSSDPNTLITQTGPGTYRVEHRDVAASSTATPADGSPREAERQDALGRWRARGARDYRVDVERECSCATRAYRIQVRNGRAVSISAVDGSEQAGPEGLLLSVDDMFALLAQRPPPYDVEYDPTYGFPRSTRLHGPAGDRDQGSFSVSGYATT